MKSTLSPARVSRLASPVIIAVLMIVLLALPLAAFRYLPLEDLPNHEARLWLESSLSDTPELAQYYLIGWRPSPALGLDLATAPTSRLFGTDIAVRIFLISTIILLAAGLLLINRALARRASICAGNWPLWPLTGLLFFYNKVLSYGFISFLGTAAAGLVVIALALNWRGRREPWRYAILVVCAFALLLGHGHAYACTGLAVAAAEIGAQRRERASPGKLVIGVGLAILPFALAFALFLLLPGHYATGLSAQYNLRLKVHSLGSLFLLYNTQAETWLTPAAGAAFILAWWRKWLVVPSETRWMGAALIAAWLALPFSLAGSDYADYRVPIVITWIVIAGSIVPGLGRRRSLWPGAILLALTSAETANVAYRWSVFQPAYAMVDTAFNHVPAGARVLTVSNNIFTLDRSTIPPLLHAPMRSVWRRHAFVSGLFLNGGVPVHLQPAYAYLGKQADWSTSMSLHDTPSERQEFFSDDQLAGYNYLAVLLPAPIVALIPKKLQLITTSRWMALYYIPPSVHPSGGPVSATTLGAASEAMTRQQH